MPFDPDAIAAVLADEERGRRHFPRYRVREPQIRMAREFVRLLDEGGRLLLEPGQEIKAEDVFTEGERVDVRGRSKGRGFAGTIKRHNFHRGDMTRGGMAKRRPGAIGQCATPSRVLKGKKMSGQMGNRFLTVRNLELVRIDAENHYLLLRGAVPGPINGEVVIQKTKKGVRVAKYASSK